MELICDSSNLNDYMIETDIVNFSHPTIQAIGQQLFHANQTMLQKIEAAFHFVRDDISHSWDIQSKRVTCAASEVLQHKEGICYAKSHLFAALLRSQSIATGFCYQRLMLFDTPEKGYCIHALNAVYVSALHKWIRLDARGNKPGVDAQFSIEEEKLAFSINEQQGEVDYPTIYANPHVKTVDTLKQNDDAIRMYMEQLPMRL